MKIAFRMIAVAALATCASAAFAQKGETVKIAWIDPLSGLMAPVGNNQLKRDRKSTRLNSSHT